MKTPEVLEGVAEAPADESGDAGIELDAGSGSEASVEVPVDPADGITIDRPDVSSCRFDGSSTGGSASGRGNDRVALPDRGALA